MLAFAFTLLTYGMIQGITALYVLGQAWLGGRAGIVVEKIGVGLGPTLIRTRIGDWPLLIKALPLGGYTKFKGEREDWMDEPDPIAGLPFCDASAATKIGIVLIGPFQQLAAGLLLLALPVWVGAGALMATAADDSMVRPCGVPGLAIRDQPATWATQNAMMRDTIVEFIRRLMTFESLEGWGAWFFVTTGLVGVLSFWPG
jgi:membrane-associated protease RseP (regulator of RpoE activity)